MTTFDAGKNTGELMNVSHQTSSAVIMMDRICIFTLSLCHRGDRDELKFPRPNRLLPRFQRVTLEMRQESSGAFRKLVSDEFHSHQTSTAFCRVFFEA